MILSFDTSAAHCAAVLLSTGSVIAARREEMVRGQAERLFPLLIETLEEVGIGWRDLDALAVGTGPGNFTGLRIGVAAARGLALSADLPAHGVDGFAARAEGAETPSLICIAAPRGLLHIRRTGEETVETVSPEGARAAASEHSLALVGEAVGIPPTYPLAEAAARIVERRRLAGERPARPLPFYVRPPDAAPARQQAPTLPA